MYGTVIDVIFVHQKSHIMSNLIIRYWKTALFAIIGAGVGFAYWRFIGCSTGTCPLTANWTSSTLMGGLVGLLAAPALKKNKLNQDKTADND
jgi:hypothetical protein